VVSLAFPRGRERRLKGFKQRANFPGSHDMKKIMLILAVMLFIANVTLAAGIQGEVVEIKDNEIHIEIFGDDGAGFKAGAHVRLEVIPEGVPTLDMLKG
jgi:hypothetical protein